MQREKKSLNDFKCGTFTGRFPSDGAASMAVKGLITELRSCVDVEAQCGAVCFRTVSST